VRLGGKRGDEDRVGRHHLVEARPYLTRMATECIGAVAMELFERSEVEGPTTERSRL
jgi:hypothetical protein